MNSSIFSWKVNRMYGLVACLVLMGCSDGLVQEPIALDTEIRRFCDADPTGESDATVALNQCVATTPEGAILQLVKTGRYRVEGVVRIVEKSNITIEGNGATIFALTDGSGVTPPDDIKHLWPRQRAHVEIVGGSNITIRNLIVKGANPNAGSAEGAYVESLEGQHGFDLRGANGVLLEDITVTDTYGDLLYIGPRGDDWSRNVTVRRAHLERSGRQGIALTGVEDAVIEDSYIGEIGRTIIDIEPFSESGGARRVTFSRNTFGYCRHLWVSSGGRGPNVSDILFEDNTLVGMGIKVSVSVSSASPPGTRRGRHAFYRNVSDTTSGGPQPAFRFFSIDGVEVVDNVAHIASHRHKPGVYACNSTAIIVQGNDFRDATAPLETSDTCSGATDDSS